MPRPYASHVPGDLPHGILFHHFHGGAQGAAPDATHAPREGADGAADPVGHPPRQGSLTAAELEELLDYVGASCSLLPAEEWLRRALAGELEPRDVCLTFDDCLRCQLDLAVPVLARRGLTGFFFVYSSVLQGGLEKLEIYAHFRHACFSSMEAFYRDFFEAVGSLPGGRRHLDEMERLEPATYLADRPFYSDDDRRFRYLRDRILGPKVYGEVMDAMVGDRLGPLDQLAPRLWMGEEDVRALRDGGHVVGLHSFSHPTDLAALDPAAQRAEYGRNAAHLRQLLGAPPTTVAHPCGSYDQQTLSILRDLGVEVGFRADLTLGAGPSRLELPRQNHANIVAMSEDAWPPPADRADGAG